MSIMGKVWVDTERTPDRERRDAGWSEGKWRLLIEEEGLGCDRR